MDRLSFLGEPNEEAEVDALVSQLSDEYLMMLKVNSHSKYNKYPSVASGSEKCARIDDDGVLDSELSSRLANLKAAQLQKSSVAPSSKGKQTDNTKGNIGGLTLRRSSSKREDGRIGGSDRRLSRSQSHNSNSEFLSNRSSGGENQDDSEDIDANLMARFRALKETPSPNSPNNSLVPSSRSLSSPKGAFDDYYSSSYGSSSPSASLLGRSSSRSSPRMMTTSVATSCHCSTPSPFKLLKQLSSKKLPSKPASLPSSPSSDSYTTANGRSTGNGKSTTKGSSSKKKSQHQNEDAEAEKLSAVKDVKRLWSSAADRVGLERNRVSSAEENDCLSGDMRIFSLLDSEQKYFKASSDEEKLNREADRVVEWAKDVACLGLHTSDGEDEDLELGEDEVDFTDSSSSDKRIPEFKDLKVTKPTKKKKKKWGLF